MNIESKLAEIDMLVDQMQQLPSLSFHMAQHAGRIHVLVDEVRRALDMDTDSSATPTTHDLTHLVIGQCPFCMAINRHEPNCVKSHENRA